MRRTGADEWKRTKLRAAAETLGSFGRDLLVVVAANVATKSARVRWPGRWSVWAAQLSTWPSRYAALSCRSGLTAVVDRGRLGWLSHSALGPHSLVPAGLAFGPVAGGLAA